MIVLLSERDSIVTSNLLSKLSQFSTETFYEVFVLKSHFFQKIQEISGKSDLVQSVQIFTQKLRNVEKYFRKWNLARCGGSNHIAALVTL